MLLRRVPKFSFPEDISSIRRCGSWTELPNLSDELPELPSWIRIRQNPDADDFVIPPIAEWAGNPNPICQKRDAAPMEQDENERITRMVFDTVTRKHSSVNSAVAALNGTGIRASSKLVSQSMKRLSNDWKSAYAVFTWARSQTECALISDQYEFMVDVLGKYHQFDLMWDIIREVFELHGRVSFPIVTKVMRRLAKARKHNEAGEVFLNIHQYGLTRDVEVLNTLMDALVKGGNVELAHEIFNKFIATISPNVSSFNVLVHGYCKAKKLDEAKNTMAAMEDHGFTPDIVCYTSIVEFFCNMKDFRNVERTLKEMREKGCRPNVCTYTIVMHALGKSNQMKEVLDVYETMKQEGCVADAPFYSSFIFILCKSGRFKDAWEAFEDMEMQYVARDRRTYNTMISSLCRNLQEEEALNLLVRMGEDSCEPDIGTYVPLIKLSCKLKRMKVLGFLLDHMVKNGVSLDFSTYTVLVEGFLRSGKVKRSALFFCEMVSKGMTPRRDTCKRLVEKLEHQDMAEIKQMIQKIMSQMKL